MVFSRAADAISALLWYCPPFACPIALACQSKSLRDQHELMTSNSLPFKIKQNEKLLTPIFNLFLPADVNKHLRAFKRTRTYGSIRPCKPTNDSSRQ